jgi:predicted MFS family arabinose efflux permease
MPAPYRWVILAVCMLSFIQVHIHRLAFSPLIPTFVADLGITYAAAGAIQTAYFWTYTLVQVPIGLCTDRWGARRVMLVFLSALCVGTLLFAASHSYPASIAARALVGLGAAAVWVPGMRLIAEWFPVEERGRVTGLFSAGGGVGGTLALVLVPWLAERWGWRLAYAATVVPVLVVLALIGLLVREREAPGAAAPRREGALWRVLGTPAMWPFNLTVLFSYGGYFSMLTFLPAFFVRRMGFSGAQAGLVTSLITAGTIVSWPLAGYVSDRLGRPKAVYLFSQTASMLVCVVFALIVPGFAFGGAALVAVATGLLVGGMITPYVMVIDMFPRDLAGTVTGVINASCFAGGMVLPVILGRVVDVTGSFPAAFLVAGGVQLLALVFGAFIRERRKP